MRLPSTVVLLLFQAAWAPYARPMGSGALPCGAAPRIGLPRDASISTEAGGLHTLNMRGGAGTAHVLLPGVMDVVEQACEVTGGKLLVFGKSGRGVYNTAIVDLRELALQDSLYGYTPLLSPNQRWIIWRKFYPAQAPNPSEEYLLYDLTKGAAANRVVGVRLADTDAVGRVAYPAVREGRPFENGAYPPEERHVFRAESFYWAADSSAVVFADSVGDQGPLVLVLVVVGDAQAAAHIRRVPIDDVCSSSTLHSPANPLTLTGAIVSPGPNGTRNVEGRFSGGPCETHELAVPQSEFQPAPVVAPAEPRRKPSVREQ